MTQHKRQTGLSMIEVMVSLFIIALGLLGLASLQSRTLMYNQSAYQRTIAADLANDLAERIRANRTPFLLDDDAASDMPLPTPPDFSQCTTASLSSTPPACAAQVNGRSTYLVVAEMAEWNRMLQNQLPQGRFALAAVTGASTGFLRYTLTISWRDDHAAGLDSNYTVVIE
ncbi:type IV pilus modification protein PilV [Aquitalea sp. S1-19]|nr:type IV pilus modification protein PilV [Aquitalea sp. S1-19]